MLYRPEDGITLQTLPSIRIDGGAVLIGYQRDKAYGVLRIDTTTGVARTIVEHDWWINHAHFTPHDPSWISFCHEGRTETIPDRMWAWHAEHAPRGRALFDQASRTPGVHLYVGHEVACHHDASLLVVAYGASPEGPRGLYEVFLDDRRPRLISEADRDLHCNISPDGRQAVVDTSGKHDTPGRGWENADGFSDIILIDTATGRREVIARTTLVNHPWHPHPAFSPDGHSIVYAEGRKDPEGETGRIRWIRL
jgi:hypothetical protein